MSTAYFTDKAREVLAAVGGNPESAGSLAAWAAEQHSGGDIRLGVIVGESGTLHATTRRYRDTGYRPGATYAETALTEAGQAATEGSVRLEVGLAVGAITSAAGERCIHVTFSQVCRGPGHRTD